MNGFNRKMKIDPVKLAFWCVFVFVAVVIVIGVADFNSEMNKYQKLYKGITTFEEVEKENRLNALNLADNYSYKYNNEEISVNDYVVSGDIALGRGIRYYDEEKKYPKDNDIVKLIPKAYFFTFIPEGKFILGNGYGYYIRTVKDLKEDNPGYNSSNYFKSVVLLFTFPLELKNVDNIINAQLNFKIIAFYEFHSYNLVDTEKTLQMPREIVGDIIENGVVNFYKELEQEDKFLFDFSKITVSLNYESTYLGYKILNNNEESDHISVENSRFISFNILNKNNDNSENIRLKLAFKFSLRDGLWMDVTWLSELYFEKELTTICNFKKP